MNQSGRLESVLTAFPAQVVGRHPAQVFIEERKQLGDRIGIAAVDVPAQTTDILQGSQAEQSLARKSTARPLALRHRKRPPSNDPCPMTSAAAQQVRL